MSTDTLARGGGGCRQGRRPQLHVDGLDISDYTGAFSAMWVTEGLRKGL